MAIKSPIGVAFLGLGRMGETHLRNLLGLPGVKVVVVADPRLEAAEHGKALAGAEEATTDVERAINSPSVDAVVIVTPTNTHARLLEVAAKAGKAAFTEKPIALDLAETARVVDLIREAGIPVQLGFMRRFDPGYARAKQKIDTGELGRIELFRALSRDTYPPSLEFLRGSGGLFLELRSFRKFPRPFRSGLSPGAGSLFPRVARGTQTSTRPGRRFGNPSVGVGSDQELARRPAGED